MPLGRLKQVENTKRKFGSSKTYWFVKIQSEHGYEEYWLVTDRERERFLERASKNPEDDPEKRRGILTVVPNEKRRFGSDKSYFSVAVREKGRGNALEDWMMTAPDVERLRQRSEDNHDDLEANRENWLADLLD